MTSVNSMKHVYVQIYQCFKPKFKFYYSDIAFFISQAIEAYFLLMTNNFSVQVTQRTNEHCSFTYITVTVTIESRMKISEVILKIIK